MKNLKQTRKVGTAGSFFNQLMGNNRTIPVVGKGATILHYSDRSAYEVLEVNEADLSCIIDRYDPERVDKNGMSDCQSYKYEKLHGNPQRLVWRKKQGGTWCFHTKEVRIIPKVLKELQSKSLKYCYDSMIKDVYGQEMVDKIWQEDEDGYLVMQVVEGITKEYDRYDPVSIIFGVKQEYYDFSF